MKKIACATLIFSLIPLANANDDTSLIEAFSHCDSTFVSTLYHQEINHDALIESSKDKIATFKVKDRHNADENMQFFETPLKDENATIVGYYDSVTDLSDTNMGKYYFWGIYLDESMNAVKKQLSQYDWQSEGNVFYANAQRYNDDLDQWDNDASIRYGVPPETGVERMLSISEDRGKTILTCSIQGEISDRFLIKYRPELFMLQ